MVDIDKHISHWQTGAEEDFEVASQLIKSNKIRHGLFFLHLTLEKILKAHVCRHTKDIAPKIHNLVRLAELSDIDLEAERIDFLSEMNPCNIEGRYPEAMGNSSFAAGSTKAFEENRRIVEMTEESIKKSVKKYLRELLRAGIPVRFGILFGSYARGDVHQWSDIDLLVVSNLYDKSYRREDVNILWKTAARTDSRIEPIPVGVNRWEQDDESTILEIARREGIRILV